MAQPLKGGQPTADGQQQSQPQPQLTKPKLLDNAPTPSLAQALKKSQAQVNKSR